MSENNWFASDHHFFHKNVIKYCNRPFDSVEEMNETMINNHNKLVDKKDNVYFVGDFCFGKDWEKILTQLNGKIHLIFGNHDKAIRNKVFRHPKIIWSGDYKEIKINDQHIVLSHYAMRVWNRSHHDAWQLYGHSHGTLEDDPRLLQIDVGVDTNEFKPYSFDEIKYIMDERAVERNRLNLLKSVDHHGEIRP